MSRSFAEDLGACSTFSHIQNDAGQTDSQFGELYEKNLAPLLAYALRRVSVPGDAADVVAETFLIAWRRFEDVPTGRDATLWLFGVARNVLANHRRAGARRIRLAERLRLELIEEAVPASHPPDRQVVKAALDRLSADDRELLTLANWEGLTPLEIAKTVGVTPAAARTRLSRARKRMQKQLEKQFDEGGRDD